MATKILTKYKLSVKSLELEPATGGIFELILNDELVYSKNETGSFPDEDAMVEEVGKRL